LHRAGYAACGLDWTFTTRDVPPGGLADFVAGLDGSWRGLAVTMPHKEAALALGTPDEVARLVGAANTVVFDADTVRVYNTDVPGAVQALAAHGIHTVTDAVIVGAGATARSLVAALARIGLQWLIVLARRPEPAAALRDFALSLGVKGVEVAELTARTVPLPPTDLLVSTLPGEALTPYIPEHLSDLLPDVGAVFDVSYDPWERPLLELASAFGMPTVDGLDLLAGQAVSQFQLFTGYEVEFDVLRNAGLAALAER
jgi:shikimate dehydrogenase